MHELTTASTVGDIVAHDLRSASVLARHGIDFCCGGRRPLDEACRERGVDPDAVMRELDALGRTPTVDATTWPLDRVIDHILDTHHAYVRRQIPALRALTQKVVAAHGTRHPEVGTIARVFDDLGSELERHMEKEEQILFPYVRAMAAARLGRGRLPANPFGTVRNPIRMMEIEHSDAGDDMRAIRQLTDDYQAPDDACATWRACYTELAEFERDLHEHVHLENNVLFPAAVRMEEELS